MMSDGINNSRRVSPNGMSLGTRGDIFTGGSGGASNSEALQWENRMREQVYGPAGPNNAPRIAH